MPALKLVNQSLAASGIELTAITAVRRGQGKWEFKEFPILSLIVKRFRPTVELHDFEDVIEYGYLVMDGASAPLELGSVSEFAQAVMVIKSSALPLTDFLKHQLIDSAGGQARPASGIVPPAPAVATGTGTEILQNPPRAGLPMLRRS